MSAELIGAIGLIVGSAVGVGGSYLVERRRHRYTLREWHLEKRAAHYLEFLTAIRAARSHMHQASQGNATLRKDERVAVSVARYHLRYLPRSEACS